MIVRVAGKVIETASNIGTVTADFGSIDPAHPIPHTGIDFACPMGTRLFAPEEGVVSSVRHYGDTNLGNAVFVRTDDGHQYVLGHLSEIKVQEGEHIHEGELLGLSGNSGNSTGPHLHYGEYNVNGNPIDPGQIDFTDFTSTIYVETPTQPDNDIEIPDGFVSSPDSQPEHEIDFTSDAGGGPESWFDPHPVSDYLQQKMADMAANMMDNIGDAIAAGVHNLVISFFHVMPITLTLAGVVCFMLTMALGRGKPYAWGLACWGASAVMRVMYSGIVGQ